MPRKKFLPNGIFPYSVSARCTNKEWFQIPMDEVWEIFSIYLFFIRHAFGVRIHSFVLMNNHFHLIISTPHANLDEVMNYFMRETSRVISRASGRINQVFGGPYYWSLMTSLPSYLYGYKYIYRNPVEAGLCSIVEEYRYSSLSSLLGQSRTIIPIERDDTLFSNVERQLEWLNEPYPTLEHKNAIKFALRKRKFCFAKDWDPGTSARP